MNKKESILL